MFLPILNSEEYAQSQRIPPVSRELLMKATITSKTLSCQCRRDFRAMLAEKHNNKLRELCANKMLSVTQLEDDNQVWKRVLQGLPAGQLIFLLRAGTDALPTPLNLQRWRWKMDQSKLCGNRQSTIHHIPSKREITWRHYSALQTLVRV